MRRSVAVPFVVVGLLAAATARPAVTRAPAEPGDDTDARKRQADDLNLFNRQVAAELARGRLGLGEATDHVVEANADRPGYLPALRSSVGGPTVREAVARSLMYRVETAAGAEVAHPALRAEYAALFGRPYEPPGG